MKRLLLILTSIIIVSSCSSSTDCQIPEDITYTSDIKVIIEENCYACHAPDVYKKKGGNVKLFEFEKLKKLSLNGVLMGSVNHEKGYIAMPYRKGTKIDKCASDKLQKWIDGGCKK